MMWPNLTSPFCANSGKFHGNLFFPTSAAQPCPRKREIDDELISFVWETSRFSFRDRHSMNQLFLDFVSKHQFIHLTSLGQIRSPWIDPFIYSFICLFIYSFVFFSKLIIPCPLPSPPESRLYFTCRHVRCSECNRQNRKASLWPQWPTDNILEVWRFK